MTQVNGNPQIQTPSNFFLCVPDVYVRWGYRLKTFGEFLDLGVSIGNRNRQFIFRILVLF